MDLKVKQNWQHLYDQYLKSGMTKADFCKSQKIAQHTFFYYQKFHGTINQTSARADQPSKLFLPVTERKEFKIKVNNSITLSFELIPEASWMASFVNALGETSARS